MHAKDKNSIKYISDIGVFLFALIYFYMVTWGSWEMNTLSYDAADIWKTITTFHSGEMYPSYVLYKGINAVYPYVWLYQLAIFVGVNEWFFIKLFYGVCFAYVSTIGFPSIVEKLLQNKVSALQRCLMAIVMWYLWNNSLAFTQLMIDLPCLAYFVLLLSFALRLYRRELKFGLFVLCGLLCGLCMSASGQYTMPAICIIIFIAICAFKNGKSGKKRAGIFFLYMCPFIICIGLVLLSNTIFEKDVVDVARQEGAWIPSGSDWLESGLVRFRYNYRAGGAALEIPSNRKSAILIEYYGGEEYIPTQLTTSEYISIFLKYPIDSLLNYLNSFFLVLSPDGGVFHACPLWMFYTMIYIAVYEGMTRCDTWRKFFSPLFWIGFSFLWATVPMLVMNIEARTCMQIQGLIIALAVCGNTLKTGACGVAIFIKECWKNRNVKAFTKIPYPIVFYVIFICFCFMHMASLYDGKGIDPGYILINF